MSTTKPYVIGMSGKIGAGKNYLANALAEVLRTQNFTTGEASYGIPLKDELTQIYTLFREFKSDEEISLSMNIPLKQVQYLSELSRSYAVMHPNVDGWTRSEYVRKGLQYLGTEIRRAQYNNYWVDKIESYFPEADYVFITDVRFPNEADKVLSLSGTLIRIEVPDEVILKRTSTRDGLKYSPEALNHSSEKALDGYKNFSLIIGETFSAPEIVNFIHNHENTRN